jgi:hypothetical protein
MARRIQGQKPYAATTIASARERFDPRSPRRLDFEAEAVAAEARRASVLWAVIVDVILRRSGVRDGQNSVQGRQPTKNRGREQGCSHEDEIHVPDRRITALSNRHIIEKVAGVISLAASAAVSRFCISSDNKQISAGLTFFYYALQIPVSAQVAPNCACGACSSEP